MRYQLSCIKRRFGFILCSTALNKSAHHCSSQSIRRYLTVEVRISFRPTVERTAECSVVSEGPFLNGLVSPVSRRLYRKKINVKIICFVLRPSDMGLCIFRVRSSPVSRSSPVFRSTYGEQSFTAYNMTCTFCLRV